MRKSLVLLVLLVLITPALAQSQQVTSVDQSLDLLIGVLGQDAIEFILAFGIIFAVVFMAFNLSSEISHNTTAKTASGVIAALVGFGAAIYIHMSNINLLAFIASFGLIIALVGGFLLIAKVVKDLAGKEFEFSWGYLALILFVVGLFVMWIGSGLGSMLLAAALIIGLFIAGGKALSAGKSTLSSHGTVSEKIEQDLERQEKIARKALQDAVEKEKALEEAAQSKTIGELTKALAKFTEIDEKHEKKMEEIIKLGKKIKATVLASGDEAELPHVMNAEGLERNIIGSSKKSKAYSNELQKQLLGKPKTEPSDPEIQTRLIQMSKSLQQTKQGTMALIREINIEEKIEKEEIEEEEKEEKIKKRIQKLEKHIEKELKSALKDMQKIIKEIQEPPEGAEPYENIIIIAAKKLIPGIKQTIELTEKYSPSDSISQKTNNIQLIRDNLRIVWNRAKILKKELSKQEKEKEKIYDYTIDFLKTTAKAYQFAKKALIAIHK